MSSYAIANVIILPLSAWLGTRFGKKNYFVFSLGQLYGRASISLRHGDHVLHASSPARVLQGLAGGGLLAKAQAILFETFPREEQAMAQAFFGIIVIAGPAIGPTLGGYLVTNVNWRWIFFINLPVGIAATMLCLAVLPTDSAARNTSKVDWFALALLAVGLGSMQTVLEEGNTDDWFRLMRFIVTLTVLTFVGIIGTVWRCMTAANPVVDFRVLRYRSLWAGSILSVIIGIALYGALFAIPLFAQTAMLGFTSQQTGMMLLPGALASAVAMPIAGKILKAIDARIALVGGSLLLVLALSQLANLSPASGTDQLFWPLIIRAFGTVLMFLPLSLATLGMVPKKDIAAATGFYSLTRQLGGSVGVALLTTLPHAPPSVPPQRAPRKGRPHGRAHHGSPRGVPRPVHGPRLRLRGRARQGDRDARSHREHASDGHVVRRPRSSATAVLITVFLPLAAPILLGKGGGAAPADAH